MVLSLQAVLRFCLCDPLVSHWITITAQGSLHKCSSLFQAKTHDLVPSPQVYLKNFTGLTRTPIVCICRLFLNSKMCMCVGSFSLIYTVYSTDFAIFSSQEISASAVSTRVLQNYHSCVRRIDITFTTPGSEGEFVFSFTDHFTLHSILNQISCFHSTFHL